MKESLKSKLKSSKPLRDAVQWLRKVKRTAELKWASSTRERLWRMQEARGVDSTQVGTPKASLKNAATYRYLLSKGIGNGQIEIQELAASKVQQRVMPLTLEPMLYPSFETIYIDPPSYVCSMIGGRVFGEPGSIITTDDQYLEDESHEHVTFSLDDLRLYQKANLPPVSEFNGRLGVAASMGSVNYYHFLLDITAKLLQVRQLQPDAYYLNPVSIPYRAEILDMLGLGNEKFVDALPQSHYRAKELIFGAFPGYYGHEPEWVVKSVREALIGSAVPGPQRRIYITREDASVRRVINEAEIWTFLESQGFEKVSLSGRTVREQISLFANAEFIIAPHGAAFANLIFASPRTKILEIFNPNEVKNLYWRIANHLDLPYAYMLSEDTTLLPFDSVHVYGPRDLTVNLEKLKATYELLVASAHN